jgi:hypothetical protein
MKFVVGTICRSAMQSTHFPASGMPRPCGRNVELLDKVAVIFPIIFSKKMLSNYMKYHELYLNLNTLIYPAHISYSKLQA